MRTKLLLIASVLFTLYAIAQAPGKQYHNDEFKWTIQLPEKFENVPAAEWQKKQQAGTKAVEKTYGEKIENNATTLLVLRSGDQNYFEANRQPFDVAESGDYKESCRQVDEVLYNTFKSQLPDAKIDSFSSEELVGGLKFYKFAIIIKITDDISLKLFSYSHLFGKSELTVNMVYIDEVKGKQMMHAWKNSVFGK